MRSQKKGKVGQKEACEKKVETKATLFSTNKRYKVKGVSRFPQSTTHKMGPGS